MLAQKFLSDLEARAKAGALSKEQREPDTGSRPVG